MLTLLLDAGEVLEERFKLQKAVLGDSHVVFLESTVEQARCEQRSLKKGQKAFFYDTSSVCCPSDKLVALHEFHCKRMMFLSKEYELFRSQRVQLGHSNLLRQCAQVWACTTVCDGQQENWLEHWARSMWHDASFSAFSRLAQPALVFFLFYVAPALLWYLLAGPYYNFLIPVIAAAGFAIIGSGLFSCYTAGHIRSEWIVAKKLRRALADPRVPHVQDALAAGT